VPSVCRRIVVLLVVALIGVGGPVASAFAQSGGGAGDQQYEDPFGGSGSSGSGSSGSGSSGSSGSGDSGAQPLTQAPQSSSSGSSTRSSSSGSGTSTSGTATAAPSAQASGTLPNTGLDARVLVLAGVVLVVAGIGLRMRNAPERF
jgi:LPXTG-motif cell wall-anchored protein